MLTFSVLLFSGQCIVVWGGVGGYERCMTSWCMREHLSLQWGETALMKASAAGQVECIKALLDRRAKVNMQAMVSGVDVNPLPMCRMKNATNLIACGLNVPSYNNTHTIQWSLHVCTGLAEKLILSAP